jgi:hypothetical protein
MDNRTLNKYTYIAFLLILVFGLVAYLVLLFLKG